MSSFKVLLLILACLWISDAATDTLNLGDKLNSSDRLVSQNGAVTLRFYKQEYGETWDDKAAGYYLAMGYTEDSLNHSIWLANRDDPIADDSGVLIIDNTGLKITRAGGNPIQLFSLQSASTTTNSSNLKLVLQDSGNLIFLYANSSGENILWQSFDYPTDTLLPGMKLGVGHGKWSLTSWSTDSIPARGAFTLEWDPVEKRLVIRLREMVLWTTGKDFENIPPVDSMNLNYNFTHVSSGDENYLYYTLIIDKYTPKERRKNARLVLRVLQDYVVLELGNSLGIFDSRNCAGDSTEKGCERWEGPKCRSNGDKYEKRSITPTVLNSINYTLLGNYNLTLNDCKDICWKDCQCLGVYPARDLGCQFLSGPYVEGELGGESYQVIIHKRSSAGSKNWIWILISLAMALMITMLLGILFYLRRRRRIRREEKFLLELMTSDKTSEISELQTGNNGHNLNIYTAALIMSATNGFSPDNLLGKGGFGPVFKGTLPNGQEVAIKRLSRGSGQGLVDSKMSLYLLRNCNTQTLCGS